MPTTKQCTESASQLPALNAIKHGILSRHLLLQCEEAGEYNALLEGVQREYGPEGVTEHHLVEELAGIIWRKRRLRIAEAAYYQKALKPDSGYNYVAQAALAYISTDASIGKFDLKKALAFSEEENRKELLEIAGYREPAIKAFALLDEGASYESALKLLAEGTREWWEQETLGEEAVEGGFTYQATVEHLQHFLRFDVLPQYNQEHEEARYRPLVKRQAEGEAFIPGDRLEKFSRYEVHLDRKFERTLTVLLRLQEMRESKGKTLPQGQVA